MGGWKARRPPRRLVGVPIMGRCLVAPFPPVRPEAPKGLVTTLVTPTAGRPAALWSPPWGLQTGGAPLAPSAPAAAAFTLAAFAFNSLCCFNTSQLRGYPRVKVYYQQLGIVILDINVLV